MWVTLDSRGWTVMGDVASCFKGELPEKIYDSNSLKSPIKIDGPLEVYANSWRPEQKPNKRLVCENLPSPLDAGLYVEPMLFYLADIKSNHQEEQLFVRLLQIGVASGDYAIQQSEAVKTPTEISGKQVILSRKAFYGFVLSSNHSSHGGTSKQKRLGKILEREIVERRQTQKRLSVVQKKRGRKPLSTEEKALRKTKQPKKTINQ
jgi:hypothetical protein